MSNQITEQDYRKFIDSITSKESKDEMKFSDRTTDLCYAINDVESFPRLLTGAMGLSDEAGEVLGIMKKVMFQGKDLNDETIDHLKREVGDCRFYLEQLYMALNMDDSDARQNNYDKLSARFPNGMFEVDRSENREAGDT